MRVGSDQNRVRSAIPALLLAKGAHQVLVRLLRTASPMQNSQTMSAALPGPRMSGHIAGGTDRPASFCSGPATSRSSSADVSRGCRGDFVEVSAPAAEPAADSAGRLSVCRVTFAHGPRRDHLYDHVLTQNVTQAAGNGR